MKLYKLILLIITCLFSIIILSSCKKNNDITASSSDTWAIIQDSILTPSCAKSGCHSSTSDATYNQHNLILTAAVAYENLVNKTSKNNTAVTEGLLRVKPGDFINSLLYQKIDCQIRGTASKYGASMPLGTQYLTVGQIELIKQWIVKGAPKTGSVVGASVLTNTAICSNPFVPMAAPNPADGFQLKIDPFSVNSNTEREIFVSRLTPNSTNIYVNKFVLQGRQNSHHFVLYGFQNPILLPPVNTVRDLYNPDGTYNINTFAQMQNHVFLGGGTDVNQIFTFPAGVAIKFSPSSQLDLNAHYFNKQASSLIGENYINLYTVPQASVTKEAKSINFPNYNFSIPANTRKTITTDFTFTQAVTVITLTSHFHKTGEKFQIKIYGGPRHGEVVYENSDWEHPIVLNLTTPIQLNAGEGLTSVVTYNNTTNKTISFGLTSEDEMNIIFGYYY